MRLIALLALLLFATPAWADSALVLPDGCAPSTLYSSGVQTTTQNTQGQGCVTGTVTTTPTGVTSTNASSTITLTGTFQSLQVATTTRKGCLVQNGGTHNMSVFFGAIGGATTAKSVTLLPNASVNCSNPGGTVLTDQVSITGTTGDAFAAYFQ